MSQNIQGQVLDETSSPKPRQREAFDIASNSEEQQHHWTWNQILPDKNILARVYWQIIQSNPFGFIAYAVALAIEDVGHILISASIVFSVNSQEIFFGKSNEVGNTFESTESPAQNANFVIIVTGCILGILLAHLLTICYLYREFKSNDEADQEPVPQILCKIQSLFYTGYGTFLHLPLVLYSVWTVYLINEQDIYTQSQRITQIVLTTLMSTVAIIVSYMQNSFYNLNFMNPILINSRSQNQQQGQALLKPAYQILTCALSLQTIDSKIEKTLYIGLIFLVSGLQLLQALYTRTYFNIQLNQCAQIIKICKTSALLSLTFTAAIDFTIYESLLQFAIIFPSIYGIFSILYKSHTERIYARLSNQSILDFKDANSVEQALLQSLDSLFTQNQMEHAKFDGLLISNEEKIMDERLSYTRAINNLIKMHERLHQDETEEQDGNRTDMINNGKISISDFGNRNSKDPNNQNSIRSYGGFNSHQNGKQDEDIAQFTSVNDEMVSQIESCSNIEGMRMMPKISGFKLDTMAKLQNQTQSQFLGFKSIDGLNQQLEDIFQNEAQGRRNVQMGFNNINSHIVKINGIDLDINNIGQSIKTIKLRFFYEVLLKQAMQMYPENLAFMLLKSYISMDLFQNKYLALTAITHINTLSQKQGFQEQLQNLISVNYFLKTLLTKSQLQGSTGSSKESSIQICELDSAVLLEQSLKVDEIIDCVKNCTLKIAHFWQITASESISREQIKILQKTTLQISEMLQQIRTYVKQMESLDSFQSSCHTLGFYLSHFFVQVLRDRNAGQMITKQMVNLGAFGRSQHKIGLIDEVGVVVVDGNFGLYGKMVFANKIISKMLGYQTQQIYGKLIHQLMPSAISEVHNTFWSNFAQIGVAKVLDYMRYLYVKDAKGYVTPFKIFIKFQFSPKYGYSFVGIFRKPQKIQFEEQEPAIRMKRTYQMICNEKGKILEISPSCRNLFKLTPQILDTLHSQMEQNFLLSFFNPNLVFSQMDFSKYSAFLLKNVNLNIGNLKEVSANFEGMDRNQDESGLDPFANMKQNFKCTMKIIKEVYGSSTSVQVSLYYVIFAEQSLFANNQNHSANNIGSTSIKQYETQPERDSIDFNPTKEDLDLLSNSDDSNDDPHIGSIINKSTSDGSSVMNTASVSSTGSSKNTTSDTNIRYVDEGIDYDKTPKPLIFMKLSTLLLFISLTVLSSVQYGLNKQYEQNNSLYQKVLVRAVSNTELISQLTIMTRTYMNIKLGLEPEWSEWVGDRRTIIKEDALQYIDTIKENMQYLHYFFKTKALKIDINDDGIDESDQLNYKNTSMYSVLSNNELSMRQLSRMNAMTNWIVQIYEIYVFDNFTSNLGTYQEFSKTQQSKVTHFDQTYFYVMVNGLHDFQSSMIDFSDVCGALITQQVMQSIVMNQFYVGISTILVIILTISSLYFLGVVIRFKSRVLNFFTELDVEIMMVGEKTAREYFNFIVNDQMEQLLESRKELEEYQLAKQDQNFQENRVMQYGEQNALAQSRQIKVNNQKSVKFAKEVDEKKGSKGSPIKNDGKRMGLASNSSSSDESKQSEEDENQKNVKKGTIIRKKDGTQTETKIKKQSSKRKQKLKIQDEDAQEKHLYNLNNIGVFNENANVKNKEVANKLNEDTNKQLTNVAIIGILLTFFFIAYFVTHYLLFVSDEIQIMNNSHQIRKLVDSIECTDSFLMEVKNLQVSNATWYDQRSSALGYKITYVSTEVQAHKLNETYASCIKINQQVSHWLQTQNSGLYNIDDSGSNSTLCSLIEQKRTSPHIQNHEYNVSSCMNIYQGVLKRSVLQSTSVFLQDSLYNAIRFLAPQSKSIKTELWIKEQLSLKASIDLFDAHSFYQQENLRILYGQIISEIMLTQSQQVLTNLFIMFMTLMITFFFVLLFFIIHRIQISFWHAFYILRLMPKDEVQREFIKRINEYLNKA